MANPLQRPHRSCRCQQCHSPISFRPRGAALCLPTEATRYERALPGTQ